MIETRVATLEQQMRDQKAELAGITDAIGSVIHHQGTQGARLIRVESDVQTVLSLVGDLGTQLDRIEARLKGGDQ